MVSLLGFLVFFGFLVGSPFMNPLGDIWGRAIAYKISMVMHIVGNICLLLSHSLYLHYISLFIIGFASSGRVGIGHIWLLEHLPNNKQSHYTTIMRVIDALMPLIVSILFEYGLPSWRLIFYGTLCASIFCLIGSFFIPESSKYLLSMNRIVAAKRNMKRIARWNGTYDEIFWKDFNFEENPFDYAS